jgi:hypothetical protein
MQLSHAQTPGPRVPDLDAAIFEHGVYLPFYDPTGDRHGIPTYPYHWAPAGLLTRRQLRAQGLRPGGQPIVAQILWRRGKRVAYLYHQDEALPKRTATPAQLHAIARALRARRTCPICGAVKSYYIPRRTGECNDCTDGR